MGWEKWRGDDLVKAINDAARMAVLDTLFVIEEAADQQVPHDAGDLEQTGIVLLAPDGSPAGVVCYGGGPGTGKPLLPYAVRWHENNANFQKGRKRFYLRDPLNALGAPKLTQALQMRLGAVLR